MAIFNMPIPSAYGQNVKPFDGAKLSFFEPGTTTPKTSYQDPNETTPHTDPVVADGAGRFPAIYISGQFKAILTDKNDVQIWEEDNLVNRSGDVAILGDFDSSTNSGDYPATGSTGDKYYVTERFQLNPASGGHTLQVGDFIVALKAASSPVDADWAIERGVVSNVNTIALVDSASIATDCSKGKVFTVTITADRTLANPTNKIPGETYTWEIAQDGTGGHALSYGTDFDFVGSDMIRTGPGAITVIEGVVISATSIRCYILPQSDLAVDFESKNLLIDVQSTTTSLATADRISLLNSDNRRVFKDALNELFDIATDLMPGTSAKDSTWYQKWISVAADNGTVTRLLVPDLEGAADGTSANELVDSTNTFATDKVKAGDTVYNLTDRTQTTVATTPTVDGANLVLNDDIFVSGESYLIRLNDPEGLSEFKARIGAAYRNSSSNFDDSYYTQIQEEKYYSEDAGDYVITASNWTTTADDTYIRQINDWTGRGRWKIDTNFLGSISTGSGTVIVLSMSGITTSSKTSYKQAVTIYDSDIANGTRPTGGFNTGLVNQGSANIAVIRFNVSVAFSADYGVSANITLDKKPSFHT